MEKKKILLMSDDLRMHSGVATQSKEFVMGTLHKYQWVQLGAAIKHPERGKIVDMNEHVRNETGIKDAYLKIYPSEGYGNPEILREIMNIEKPDAILHFTDPRFWIWLYQMEHEIRQNIPIFYLNIWDDLPTPKYNTNYYRSSDLLMGISKQTYGINKRILNEYDYEDWQIKYVPHGIDTKQHYKVDIGDTKFKNFENKYGLDKYKFKILYLNRNIRRKQPGDVVMAYKHFMDNLTEEQRKECCLVFHTQPSDENGTDIKAVCQNMIPNYNVIFTYDNGGHFNDEEINFIYNSVDVYINLASNEGFGLGSAEALMTETPIVVNVTGGLQDQCGFKKRNNSPDGSGYSESYLTADDYVELGSNHRGQYKEHGVWVKPVFPSNISLQGSPLTPYIFDDRAQFEDAGDALKYWYDMDSKERNRCGKLGKEYMMDKNIGMTAEFMSDKFIEYMDMAFKKWKPRKRYSLEAV
jgi:glycosyltransferase involved in cell wall biosynthesis